MVSPGSWVFCAWASPRDPEPPAADSILPDSLMPDSIMPDSVAPDSIRPDSIRPDSIRSDSIRPDTTGSRLGMRRPEAWLRGLLQGRLQGP